MDLAACNYDPNATISGVCIYPEASCLDCAGNCIEDNDDDDVCDCQEILGCTISNACNYNSLATEDNSSCVFLPTYSIEGGENLQTPEAFCDTVYWYPYTEGSTYYWEAGGGTIDVDTQGNDTAQVFWATEGLGWISVYETDANGCVGETVTLNVTIMPNSDGLCPEDTTSITELNTLSLLAYPNPTTSDFVLEITSEARGGLLEVYDAIGRVVHTETLTQLQTQIDSDRWAAGVYTLRLMKDNQGASLRVIKE
jgi:hypothetical protein